MHVYLSALLTFCVILGHVQYGFCQVCVSNCHGVQNGDHQSCNGCDVYVTCANGITYDNRPCPQGLVWNDVNKQCDWSSDTCKKGGPKGCVTSCSGLENGNFQSCNGCNVYVTCLMRAFIDNRPCAKGLVWDDNEKSCLWTSKTCKKI